MRGASMEHVSSYFLKRASEERTAAMHSVDPRVRAVHETLAENYEAKVRALTAERPTAEPER